RDLVADLVGERLVTAIVHRHREAIAGQLQGNRLADAAHRSGDDRDLPLLAHALSPSSASNWSAVFTASERSIRRASPARTLPGPISTAALTPSATSVSTTRTHCTEREICSTSSRRRSSGW